MAASASGKVACPCEDEVKVVDLKASTETLTLAGDSEVVTAVAISSDGHSVFVASRSLQAKVGGCSTH